MQTVAALLRGATDATQCGPTEGCANETSSEVAMLHLSATPGKIKIASEYIYIHGQAQHSSSTLELNLDPRKQDNESLVLPLFDSTPCSTELIMATPPKSSNTNTRLTLEEAITQRHSSRHFTSTPVPQEKIQRALSLATHAPSNSNVQPWRLCIVTGAALDRLKVALMEAATSGSEPNIPPLPKQFAPLRSEVGQSIFGEACRSPVMTWQDEEPLYSAIMSSGAHRWRRSCV